MAGGLGADGNRPSKALRAGRWPSPTRRMTSGRRRPTVGRRPWRRLKSAFSGACALSVGLRRRKECLSGRRRPTVGRRPFEAGFIRRAPRRASAFADAKSVFPVGAGRPVAGGLGADGNRPSEALARRASAFADAKSVFPVGAGQPLAEAFSGRIHSACQADRRPKALQGRIHSTHKAFAPMKDPGGQPESAGRLYSQPESANRRNARGGGGWRGRCSR